MNSVFLCFFFFFQAEDGIRDVAVTGVQTCALPICERPLLSKEQIRENLQHQRDQMARFLEFGAGPTAAILLDNAKWLGSQGLIDFLRDVGKHFTVNVMLQKESVKARLEAGLAFTQVSYMLLQAYDFF